MTIDYRIGDCVDVLKEFPENHFDACVTDPPYGLEFMGKEWDKLAVPKPGNLGGFADGNKPSFERVKKYLPAMQAWHEAWAREVLRVLKSSPIIPRASRRGRRKWHQQVAHTRSEESLAAMRDLPKGPSKRNASRSGTK